MMLYIAKFVNIWWLLFQHTYLQVGRLNIVTVVLINNGSSSHNVQGL